jgi:hypothetical protein
MAPVALFSVVVGTKDSPDPVHGVAELQDQA